MQLNEKQIAKIDFLLQETLAYAEDNEVIRTIVKLDNSNAYIQSVLSPEQFSSRYEYRMALRELQQNNASQLFRETLNSIDHLSIRIVNEREVLSSVLTIEGTPRQLISVLELPGVLYAFLDRQIGITELIPIDYIDYIVQLYCHAIEDNIDEKLKKSITQASEQFILKYYENFGKIKILDMSIPVDLDTVFTKVKIVEQPNFVRLNLDEADEQESLVGMKKIFADEAKKIDGLTVVNKTQFLMILGQPGAGKSTFIRKIGLGAIKGDNSVFDHKCFPILLEAKYFSEENLDLKKIIIEELISCNFPHADIFSENLLKKGKFLIMFDGLDEAPANILEITYQKIQNFADTYPNNRFICSCRTAAWRLSFIKFKHVEIVDLDGNQIHQFIQNWFSSNLDYRHLDKSNKCWELLNEAEHQSTLELAKTPLLLTFICLVYENSNDFPKNRSDLYGEALDILLKKWWLGKQLTPDTVFKNLEVNLEKIMLSKIAYENFTNNKIFFPRHELLNFIQESLDNNYNAPKILDSKIILDAISRQQGILIEQLRNKHNRRDDLYSFSHLTIQEYLAAHHISNHRDIESLLVEHLTDPRWKEVFLLLAGLIPSRVDELLLLIDSEAHKYLETNLGCTYLLPLLSWTKEVISNSKSPLSLLSKRCLATAFVAANAYAYSYGDVFSRALRQAFELAYPYTSDDLAYKSANKLAYAFSFANCHALTRSFVSNNLVDTYSNPFKLIYAHALAKAYSNTSYPGIPNLQNYKSSINEFISYAVRLQKSEIFNDSINLNLLIARLRKLIDVTPSKESSSSVHRSFSETIIKTWFSGFNLDLELVTLPRKELEEIGQQYFYLNFLMVQCSKISVAVSTKTWKSIESRMLTVPD